jgi:hypothetical protein
VLFGIPLLVLGIAYAFNDPKSLAVALPLALLIPGPRDVLLHVAADVMRAAVRARRFVSVDSDADEAAAAADAAARTHRERQRRRAAAARPPPPPPPPPPAVSARAGRCCCRRCGRWLPAASCQRVWVETLCFPTLLSTPGLLFLLHQLTVLFPIQVEVELHPGEYAVYPPPAPSPLSAQDTPQPPPPPPPRRQHAAPRAPLPEVQPAATRQRGEAFAGASRGWPPVVDVSAATSQPPQQQSGHGASHGWPAACPAASSQRRRSRSRGGSLGARTAAVASAPQGSPGAMGRQRRLRSRLSQPAGKAGASGQGWGGSDVAATPLLLRPIFALIPFLRYWGGFL